MEEDDQGVFSITKVDYTPPRPVIHMVTSNNILVMALDNGKLIRLDLRDTSDLRDIDVGPNVRKLFIDPTGNHLIVSTVEDTVYLNRTWDRPKPLKTLKNLVVTSVGWDLANTDANNTGTILLGTAAGQIYEVSIEAGSASAMLRSLERGLKLLYTFPDSDTLKREVSGSGGPIPAGPCVLDGLGWFKVPGTRTTTHCVFASSSARIWQFVGGASLDHVFSAYQNVPPYAVYHTLPNEGQGTRSVELHFYHKYGEGQTLWPKSLAWFLAPLPSVVLSNAPGATPSGASPYATFHEGAWMANFSFADVASGKMEAFNSGGLGNGMGSGMSSGLSSGISSASSHHDAHQINVIDSFKHVPLGDKPADAVSTSMVLTEFHIIILYHNGLIQFISRLTNELVFEVKCNVGRSTMKGLTHDPRTNITFAYTDTQLFEIHMEQEDKNVWKMYLRNGQYDLAEQYAREEWQRDMIWTGSANHYFAQRLYKIAAEIYAKTSRSFEEVTLKFMNENATPALMVYLKEKLKVGNFQSEMQPTVLCTWLTELYLSKLNDIEAQQQQLTSGAGGLRYGTSSSMSTSKSSSTGPSSSPSGPSLQALKDSFDTLQDEFKSFLHAFSQFLDRPTIMALITSYGRVQEMLEYARVVNAYDVIVAWHVQQHEWSLALKEISSRRLFPLLYKHCPVIMQFAPDLLINTLMDIHSDSLDIREILPSLMRYQTDRKLLKRLTAGASSSAQLDTSSPSFHSSLPPITLQQQIHSHEISPLTASSSNQAIRYLEFLIHNQASKDPAVHNFLISLYVEDDDSSASEDKLLKFVDNPVACIDLEYALGLCEKHRKLRAQVAIYSKMGLYEEAVALALKGNFVDLARATADAVEDEETRKKLWLELAGHMIQKDASHDIGKVMQFIQQSGILKIEDVLPVFPAFVVINDFKDEICRSLKEYNSHINDLVLEIEDSTNAAQAIRADIDKLPNKYGAVSSNQTCELCRTPILSKSFYLFPCSHVYHQNCLIDYLKPLILDQDEKRTIIAINDALTQRRIALAQKAAMERDRDSAFASSSSSSSSSSSILPSFLDRGDGGGLSSLFSNTPLSGLNLPFGSSSSNPQIGSGSSGFGIGAAAAGGGSGAQSPGIRAGDAQTGQAGTLAIPSSFDHVPHPHSHLLHHKLGVTPTSQALSGWSEKQLQDELDNYIAAECPLCGDLMIESVPRPLVDSKSSASWDLPRS